VNVVFVNYHSFASNSAVHIFHLANELEGLGVRCAVAVPRDVETVAGLGAARFRACSYKEILRSPPREAGPTLVHAWTPRELVRRQTEELSAQLGCAYVAHLEDNEESIVERTLQIPIAELRRTNAEVPETLSHPVRYREFLAGAAGVTALIDRLLEFKPAHVPGKVIWPAFDAEMDWAQPRDERLREQLGISPAEKVVVYTGNVHAANQREVSSLYLALALLRRRGVPVRLVRTGQDHARLYDPALADVMREIVIEMGTRPRAELPRIVSLADVLVQPGGPDPFNDFRFPSKLPEFFASGRPVMLPRSNIGRHLADGEQAVLLERGNALEMARKLEPLLADEERRHRIGAAGRAFALKNFSWEKAAHELLAFYESLVHSRQQPVGRNHERAQDHGLA
jgi:glycosyltransferase involved in cell wall biosynthesis